MNQLQQMWNALCDDLQVLGKEVNMKDLTSQSSLAIGQKAVNFGWFWLLLAPPVLLLVLGRWMFAALWASATLIWTLVTFHLAQGGSVKHTIREIIQKGEQLTEPALPSSMTRRHVNSQ